VVIGSVLVWILVVVVLRLSVPRRIVVVNVTVVVVVVVMIVPITRSCPECDIWPATAAASTYLLAGQLVYLLPP
jgi:hypothetical protein